MKPSDVYLYSEFRILDSEFLIDPLKAWFLEHKRDLPWRNNPTPYQVWISEVMLQQTQVKVVIPYFESWMKRFPTIQSLAEAHLDEVIKLWEGLGYYSRARNLHEGARQILQNFGGIMPHTHSELALIKGIGPYTLGAILSFAYKQKAPAVDGNVQRVIARIFHLTDDFSKASTQKKVWDLAKTLLPDDEPWIINEALIELGALICTRTPKCSECPLKKNCQSFRHGDAADIPYKSKKIITEYLYRAVPVINCGTKLLVKRGQKGKVMSDLHEFPYFPCTSEPLPQEHLQALLGFQVHFIQTLPIITHGFTRYQAALFPYHFETKDCHPFDQCQWIDIETLKNLAFSSGHKRIFNNYTRKQITSIKE